jgi:hypothetical protein
MSTNAFLVALDRYHSKNGLSGPMYSDNGTNFVGEKYEIYKIRKTLYSSNCLSLVSSNSDMSDLHMLISESKFRKLVSDSNL